MFFNMPQVFSRVLPTNIHQVCASANVINMGFVESKTVWTFSLLIVYCCWWTSHCWDQDFGLQLVSFSDIDLSFCGSRTIKLTQINTDPRTLCTSAYFSSSFRTRVVSSVIGCLLDSHMWYSVLLYGSTESKEVSSLLSNAVKGVHVLCK